MYKIEQATIRMPIRTDRMLSYMYICVWAHMCVCAHGSQRLASSSFSSCCPSHFLDTVCFIVLEFIDSARPAGQQAHRVYLSPSLRALLCMATSHQFWGIQIRSSCLCSNNFTNGTNSSTLETYPNKGIWEPPHLSPLWCLQHTPTPATQAAPSYFIMCCRLVLTGTTSRGRTRVEDRRT